MKQFVVLVIASLVLASALSAQSTPSADIKVFAINLAAVPMDVQMGNNPALFQASALAPNAVSKLVRSKTPGSYQVYFHSSDDKNQLSPRNQGGQPYLYTLASGKTYLIRLLSTTNADLIELIDPLKAGANSPDKQAAKIFFANNTAANLPLVQIASAFNQNVLVSLKDLPAHEVCNFGSINFPAEYGCFWTSSTMPANSSNFSLSDANGKTLLTKFIENSYWALIIYSDPAKPTQALASLVDITP